MAETLQLTRGQVESAMRAAMTMDAIVGRLTYDEEFAKNLSSDPRGTMEKAGLSFDKEGMDSLMTMDPKRFDNAAEALFNLVDSEFLYKVAGPSCDPL
ncbi:Os1348 family NHLP clan protein [Kitasatospora sp. YST-16]|uniref:Os1348 family NHLP clan protein n=1 Tax=Kitasatospora sp. YST-16 TaxID=2998080 RepID=UPI0022843D85|nr:Os1348 family NHLP clan protein [Kitasatospora sp. YST-16]WAL72906.1 Os1348 family NHLP clan protein [Kitasatospora sp. YST-16]WNW38956.1 Os1348 family NHLP clan protein [Streptomyces sp. Li-HN-5-13]